MKVISSPAEMHALVESAKRQGKRIGLVPTMGALHAGHISLVRRAKAECDLAVTTIFVNPSQFGPNEDFSKYPRTMDADTELLRAVHCDWVFVPTTEHMYPLGHSTTIDPPRVAHDWEGRIRPGHFRGVTTIVLKLFHMIPAQASYFGRKDYQQVAVLKAMVRDLNVPVELIACDTVREADGLAMSSRNRYLSVEERGRALGLWRALQIAHKMVLEGCRNVQEIESAMTRVLLEAPVNSIDYAAIVAPDTMEPLAKIEQDAVAIIAARVGSTRLIDNLSLNVD